MTSFDRFTRFWLAVLTMVALAASAPATAQDSPGDFSQALGNVHAEMNALTLELERFRISARYCMPPQIPDKARDQADLDALAERAQTLNERYADLKQRLKDFAKNPRVAAEMMLRDSDPTQENWWRAYEAARRRMNDALARKRAALAAAPVVDCAPKPQPRPQPAVTTGGFQTPVMPVRPETTPTTWPELPKQFCTQEEYWAFINRLNLLTEQVAADAERAAKFRADIERALNEYVQKDQPVPAALLAQRRQAAADFDAQQRRLREADATVRRAKAIPVVDCGRDRRTGMTGKDFERVEAQQALIGELEGWIAQINALRLAGKCDEMDRLDDRARERLFLLRQMVVDAEDPQRRPAFPKEVLDDLRRRLSAASQPCPPAGSRPNIDELRRAYRAAANGNDEAAFRAAKQRLLDALDEAVASETRVRESDRLIRERDEVRTAEPARPGILNEVEPQTQPSRPNQTGFVPPSDPGMRTIFEAHNTLRAANGIPPLRWDQELVAGAQAWAEQLARTGRLGHAPREGRGKVRENVSQGMIGWNARQMIGNWLKEEKKFKPGIYPDVSTTGLWEDVSHYTQMLWADTIGVGCGLAAGSGYQWLVCRYSPGGNKDGDYVGPKVGQAIADGPKTATPPPADIAPVDSTKPTGPPPPPPPPTARDNAPNGEESKHPLVTYASDAMKAFTEAWRNGDRAAQEHELAKLRYALDQLKKRLKAARKVPVQFRTVDPDKVEAEVRFMERTLQRAEDRYNGREEFG